MKPEQLTAFMEKKAKLETHSKGQIFHSQDFAETLFMLKTGYVKRYQINKSNKRVIELIYGPGHIFPLTQLYRKLFGAEHNSDSIVYVYQAMTDIKIWRISDSAVAASLEKNPKLYIDLFYEAGLRLRSNIALLASNALKDNYKKVAHQLVYLAEEFGEVIEHNGQPVTKIAVPLTSVDMAEQLNISPSAADEVMKSLSTSGQIIIDSDIILVPNINLLKDAYL